MKQKAWIFILRFTNVSWGSAEYRAVKKLYRSAFPKKERFAIWQLLLMAMHKNVCWQSIYDGDHFIGLVFMAEDEAAVYLGYLAIVPAERGHGYGSQVLDQLKAQFKGKPIILDIEPVTSKAINYQQRLSRLKFYEHNGFRITQKKLIDDGGRYAILTTGRTFKVASLVSLLHYMDFGMYKFKIE